MQTTNTTKINLSKIKIIDLNKVEYPVEGLCKDIGNLIFVRAQSIEAFDAARILHSGEEAEITQAELLDILHLVDGNPIYPFFVHKQIVDYLKSKLEDFKTKK